MNLYAYVANDPMNATDPTGREAFFIARPIIFKGVDIGQDHAFIVVTDGDKLSDPVRGQYSFGANENGGLSRNALGIDEGDRRYLQQAIAGNMEGITISVINASDEAVIAAGDATIGHDNYSILPSDEKTTNSTYYQRIKHGQPATRTREGSANSNSAAVSIAERGAASEGNTFTVPSGAKVPGANQSDQIKYRSSASCAGSRIESGC